MHAVSRIAGSDGSAWCDMACRPLARSNAAEQLIGTGFESLQSKGKEVRIHSEEKLVSFIEPKPWQTK